MFYLQDIYPVVYVEDILDLLILEDDMDQPEEQNLDDTALNREFEEFR